MNDEKPSPHELYVEQFGHSGQSFLTMLAIKESFILRGAALASATAASWSKHILWHQLQVSEKHLFCRLF